MCTTKKKIFGGRLIGLAAVPFIMFALALMPVQVQSAVPPGCPGTACDCDTVGCGINFANEANGQNIPPGTVVGNGTQVRVTVLIGVLSCVQGGVPCAFHHGAVVLTHPDGFVETLTTDLPTASVGNVVTLVSTHVDNLNTSGNKVWHMAYGNPSNPLPDPADGSWCTPLTPTGE